MEGRNSPKSVSSPHSRQRYSTLSEVELTRNLKVQMALLKLKHDKLEETIHTVHSMQHPNILCAHSFLNGRARVLSPVPFDFSLDEILNISKGTKFWIMSLDGNRVIGLSDFFKHLILVLLSLAFFMYEHKICHNGFGTASSVVFVNDVAKLRHVEFHIEGGDFRGLLTDFKGISDLLVKICSRTLGREDRIPAEATSFINLLYHISEKSIGIVLEHPALFSPAERKIFIVTTCDLVKSKEKPGFREFLSVYGTNYNCWIKDVRCKAPELLLRRGLGDDGKGEPNAPGSLKYHCRHPVSLVSYVRNKFSHHNQDYELKISEEDLGRIFLDLFPNIFVELFLYKNKETISCDDAKHWRL